MPIDRDAPGSELPRRWDPTQPGRRHWAGFLLPGRRKLRVMIKLFGLHQLHVVAWLFERGDGWVGGTGTRRNKVLGVTGMEGGELWKELKHTGCFFNWQVQKS